MTKEAKLTIGYDGLDMSCQGCYELDPQITNHQAVHLIVSEKDKEGVYSAPFFYCASCVYSVLEKMKLEAFNVGLPPEDNRNIYKLTSEELQIYKNWLIARGKERLSKDWKKSGH
ncbi:MAG: hypothetical protein MRERV_2c029 [Mycoplasmataceae bacterium RV_VA103A]|nr:MAG: hypothetical protein MRERV_2c029 [Mycoplasmataceae bacterium RV_VA103A]